MKKVIKAYVLISYLIMFVVAGKYGVDYFMFKWKEKKYVSQMEKTGKMKKEKTIDQTLALAQHLSKNTEAGEEILQKREKYEELSEELKDLFLIVLLAPFSLPYCLIEGFPRF